MNIKQGRRFRKEILRALREKPMTTAQLYKSLKRTCPKYCDDRRRGTRQPEWKHAARNMLNDLQKRFIIYLDKGAKKWKTID